MTGFVLDASAVLALLVDEPGADRVKAGLDRLGNDGKTPDPS